MHRKKISLNFTNGIPELLILNLLGRKEMYGYELVRTIQRETGNVFSFGEGCIYPILHTLEAKRLLTSRSETVNGRIRHYYRSTPAGVVRFEDLKNEWTTMVKGVSKIMSIQYV